MQHRLYRLSTHGVTRVIEKRVCDAHGPWSILYVLATQDPKLAAEFAKAPDAEEFKAHVSMHVHVLPLPKLQLDRSFNVKVDKQTCGCNHVSLSRRTDRSFTSSPCSFRVVCVYDA